ncbi:MAG: tyrosine-protein phosphatase [Pirellulaceae bacterium]
MHWPEPFVDIHCHLLPGIDDGAKSWEESLAMAKMAVADGIDTIIVTPHQLGNFAHNDGGTVRQRADELQKQLHAHGLPLRIYPGADVRIDEFMMAGLRSGEVLTLADRRKHVLLELPHELYFPIEGVLTGLQQADMVGILSHPERNQGLLQQPQIVASLVERGCLMQVTAGSLMGTFGTACQEMAEWMLEEELVHFLATDAHGSKSRRPLLKRAYQLVTQLLDEETATDLCCRNPAAVVAGEPVVARPRRPRKRGISGWFNWRKAG